jgi:hypothetical protein
VVLLVPQYVHYADCHFEFLGCRGFLNLRQSKELWKNIPLPIQSQCQ